jgi:outer membrane protein assembly factor BamA
VTRRISFALLLLLFCATALAQDLAPARFFIERIEVRGASRVSTDVIVAESRLRAGQEYGESDLSDAAARLSRLPFLLSADFALEKGSERGRHVLVITVGETKPFFYLINIVPIFSTEYSNRQLNVVDNDRLGVGQNQGVIGARWFVGRRGAFHAGLFTAEDQHEFTRDYTAAVIGYTQYDIFGTRAFATLNIKRPLLDSANATGSPQVVVGIPVSPNQTLTLTYDETRFGTDYYSLGSVNSVSAQRRAGDREISARMTYNTTNHPFVPTRGTLLSITPLIVWRDGASFHLIVQNDGELTVTPFAYHENSWGVELDAARYFELSDQNSVWVRAEGGWGRVNERDDIGQDIHHDSRYGLLQTGFSHSLWSGEQQKRGDSRFEWVLRYSSRNDGFGSIDRYVTDRFQLTSAWVRRSSFGTIRLGVGYAW